MFYENYHKFQGPSLERTKSGTDPPQIDGSWISFYRISIMLQIFTEDSVIL